MQADQLPTLQKFGSLNEILSSAVTQGSRTHLRGPTNMKKVANLAATSSFYSNSAVVGVGGNKKVPITAKNNNLRTGGGKGLQTNNIISLGASLNDSEYILP